MQSETRTQLLELNRRFYSQFGSAFAATRRRLQPGVWRVLQNLPQGRSWLDMGCGGGTLAAQWAEQFPERAYLGIDFSLELLDEAHQLLANNPHSNQIGFQQADLGAPDWSAGLASKVFDGILAFAVFHHLPGNAMRLSLLRQARTLVADGGWLIHSEWQFQHSPRLMERRQPWQSIGLRPEDVEEGDTLLDWRYALPGQAGQTGLRYVHLFNRSELSDLAQGSGWKIVEEFESDGEGGRLGLYQIWQAIQ